MTLNSAAASSLNRSSIVISIKIKIHLSLFKFKLTVITENIKSGFPLRSKIVYGDRAVLTNISGDWSSQPRSTSVWKVLLPLNFLCRFNTYLLKYFFIPRCGVPRCVCISTSLLSSQECSVGSLSKFLDGHCLGGLLPPWGNRKHGPFT